MKIWTITADSESGDTYGPFLFLDKPTEREKEDLCYLLDGDSDRDGPGDFGSYVHLDIQCFSVAKTLAEINEGLK